MAQKPKPQKKIPQRKCVGCAQRREKRELIRVVRLPDNGGVVLDETGKKAGRGAYLCRSTVCLKKALKARRLQNALACEIPPEIGEALTEAVAQTQTQMGDAAGKKTAEQKKGESH